jgi:predicted PurR-regulated permease PerM
MEQKKIQYQSQLILNILLCIALVLYILFVGKTLFVPLSFALLIAFILFPVCQSLEHKGMHKGLAATIPVITLFSLLIGSIYLLITQLTELSYEWANIQQRALETLQGISLFLFQKLGLSADRQWEMLQNLASNVGNKAFNLAGNIATIVTEGFVFLIMIPIFTFLILFYRHKLVNALYPFFPTENRDSYFEILTETIHTYYNFIKGMLIVYLTVGTLNSIGLALIGVPHFLLFGFSVAVLTFIPYIGIMIGSLFPIIVAWTTFNSIWYPIAVIALFAFVQFLEAYVIFPLAVGKKLKLNTLIVFIVIIIGGMLWGPAGMILFIPMVSILKLIADKSPRLKYLSELLGE